MERTWMNIFAMIFCNVTIRVSVWKRILDAIWNSYWLSYGRGKYKKRRKLWFFLQNIICPHIYLFLLYFVTTLNSFLFIYFLCCVVPCTLGLCFSLRTIDIMPPLFICLFFWILKMYPIFNWEKTKIGPAKYRSVVEHKKRVKEHKIQLKNCRKYEIKIFIPVKNKLLSIWF